MSEYVEGQPTLHDGKFHWEEHLTGSQKRWLQNGGKAWVTGPASMGVSFLLYPADSIRTRMQTYGFPSIASCYKHGVKNEGLGFLYRGSLIPIMSQAAVRVVTWQIYYKYRQDFVNPLYVKYVGSNPLQTCLDSGRPSWSVFTSMFIAGAMVGATTSFVAAPSEFASIISRVDCLRGLDPNKPITMSSGTTTAQKGMGSVDAAKDMIRRRGLFSLYAGFRLHLVRDSVGSAFYYSTWEVQKLFWNTPEMSPWRNAFWSTFLSGALSGSCGWVATYSLDTAKTRYQREFVSAVHSNGPRPSYPDFNWRILLSSPKIYLAKYGLIAFKPPIRSGFTRAFWLSRSTYKGMSLLISRSMLSNALFMSSVEQMNDSIKAMKLHPDEMVLH